MKIRIGPNLGIDGDSDSGAFNEAEATFEAMAEALLPLQT